MTISNFNGMRREALFAVAASALLKNRFLTYTKSTETAAYSTYGESPDGFSTADGTAYGDSYSVSLRLFKNPETFWISLAGAVTLGDALVIGSATGQAKTKDYSVTNMHETSAPSPGADATYVVPSAGWGGLHGNAVAVYTHVGTSWAYTEMTAGTAGTVVLNAADGRYYVWSGTAWVEAPIVGYALDSVASGGAVTVLRLKEVNRVAKTDLSFNYGMMFTVASTSETDADAEVVISDPRIAVGDVGIAVNLAATNAVTIKGIVITAGTATITLSGNGGASTVATIAIFRAIS